MDGFDEVLEDVKLLMRCRQLRELLKEQRSAEQVAYKEYEARRAVVNATRKEFAKVHDELFKNKDLNLEDVDD